MGVDTITADKKNLAVDVSIDTIYLYLSWVKGQRQVDIDIHTDLCIDSLNAVIKQKYILYTKAQIFFFLQLNRNLHWLILLWCRFTGVTTGQRIVCLFDFGCSPINGYFKWTGLCLLGLFGAQRPLLARDWYNKIIVRV